METTVRTASVEEVQSGDPRLIATGVASGLPPDVVRLEELDHIVVKPHLKDGQVVMSLVDLPLRPRHSKQLENLINYCSINEQSKKDPKKYYGRGIGTFTINGVTVRLQVQLQVVGWVVGSLPDPDPGLITRRKDIIVPDGADLDETARMADTAE
jgi:hypothetical protein